MYSVYSEQKTFFWGRRWGVFLVVVLVFLNQACTCMVICGYILYF